MKILEDLTIMRDGSFNITRKGKRRSKGLLSKKESKQAQVLNEKAAKQREEQLRKYLSLENVMRKHTQQEVDCEIAASLVFLHETDSFEEEILINRRLAKLKSCAGTEEKVARIIELQNSYQKQKQIDDCDKPADAECMRNPSEPATQDQNGNQNEKQELDENVMTAEDIVDHRIILEQIVNGFKLDAQVACGSTAQKCLLNHLNRGKSATCSSSFNFLCNEERVERLKTVANSESKHSLSIEKADMDFKVPMRHNYGAPEEQNEPPDSNDLEFPHALALNVDEIMLENALKAQLPCETASQSNEHFNDYTTLDEYDRAENSTDVVDQPSTCDSKQTSKGNRKKKLKCYHSRGCMIS